MLADVDNIYSKLDNIQNLPTIPKIMFDAITQIKTEPGNVYKISEIIGKDQGMVAKILSVANSPLFGMLRKVSSIEFAIMILGSNELEKVITAISLSNAIRFKSVANFNEQEYWKHSLAVALLSKDIARRLGMPEISGDAFIAGMLHDVGVQLIVKYFPEEYQIIFSNKNENKNFLDLEVDALGISHQDVGAYLLNKWDLPTSLVECVKFHHNPSETAENIKLVAVIHLADFVANQFDATRAIWDDNLTIDSSIKDLLTLISENDLVDYYMENSELVTDTVNSIKI